LDQNHFYFSEIQTLSDPKMKKVLLYGDSLLFPLQFQEEKDFRVNNQCVCGLSVKDETKKNHLSQLLSQDTYKILLLCLGTNDIAAGELANRDVIPGLISLVKQMTKTYPNLIVGVFGFPFSQAASRDLAYRLHSLDKIYYLSFPYLDEHPNLLHQDGTHLNETGIKHLKDAISDFINMVKEFGNFHSNPLMVLTEKECNVDMAFP